MSMRPDTFARRCVTLAVVTFALLVPAAARADIGVLTPAAGVVWDIGSSQDITWSGADRGNIRIELSRDAGTTYEVIFSNMPNDGVAHWVVEGPPTITARIRVTTLDDAATSAESENFTILGLTVLTPNGGETWQTETKQSITWRSNGAGDVRIELSRDGQPFEVLLTRTANDGEETVTIPGPPANARVRITSLDDSSATDDSDQEFALVAAPPAVVVDEPHGGERWEIGTPQHIRWSGIPGGNVRVELSRDGGLTYDVLFGNIPNDGDEEWEVVSPPSAHCRVRVTRLDEPEESATSGQDFTIAGLTVTKPNGGELWVIGNQREITWTSHGTGDVQIELSRDGGETYELLFARTPNDGTEVWTVTGPPANARLRITDLDDALQTDETDAPIFITATAGVTVSEPNGGDLWAVGSRQLIRWQGLQAGRVKVELSRDGGTGWETLFTTTPDDGVQSWVVTGPPSQDCRVRVTRLLPPLVEDISDDSFEISVSPLTVIAPTEDENWIIGTQRLIRWSGLGFGDVAIDLSRDGGNTWESLSTRTGNDGAQYWAVSGPPTASAFIRIVGLDDLPGFAVAGPFTISKGSLVVSSPNGGEQWRVGSRQLVSWTSTTAGAVHIDLSRDGGANWTSVIANTPNDGNEVWTVTGPPSPSAWLRIVSWADPDVGDVGDDAFTIYCAATAMNITPGEELGGTLGAADCEAPHRSGAKGQLYAFTMPTAGVVRINLTSQSFDPYLVLVGPDGAVIAENDNVGAGTDAGFDSIALDAGGPYTIEVTSADRTRVGTYRLFLARFDVAVTSPAGGETWKLGEKHQITWKSAAPQVPVDITLFRDGDPEGVGEPIATGTPNDGVETWTVTPPATTTAVIQICIPNGSLGTRVCSLSRAFSLQPCVAGETRPCYSGPAGTAGVGVCKSGNVLCAANGIFGSCQGEVLPQTEVCEDHIDQNCDGADLACAVCPDGGQCVDGDVCTTDACVQGKCRHDPLSPWPLYDCRREDLRSALGTIAASCQGVPGRVLRRQQKKLGRLLAEVENSVFRARAAVNKRKCVGRLVRARKQALRLQALLGALRCPDGGLAVTQRVSGLEASIMGVSSCDTVE